MKGLFENLMFLGIITGIFIASAAIAMAVVAKEIENKELRSISRKMLASGIAVFLLSAIFAVV